MQQKTWGTFTGNHIVAIIAIIAFAICVPGTLWAVDAFTNVALIDPLNGLKAKIVSGRKLVVGDGSGALTVDGAVTAKETNPADFVLFSSDINGGGGAPQCRALLTAPADKAVVVKSVFVNVVTNFGSGGLTHHVRIYAAPSCPAAVPYLQVNHGSTPNAGLWPLQLEPGLLVPAGATLWADRSGSATYVVYGTGYYVPAAIPSPAATASRRQSRS